MNPGTSLLRRLTHRLAVALGSLGLTLGCFLVLPLTRAIGKAPAADAFVRPIDTANLPPPPPVLEPEPEKEEEPEEKPPELADEPERLDLAQLEVALNASLSGGWMTGDFGTRLGALASPSGDVDALFSLADLDQQPRVIHQPEPVLDAVARRKAPGSVSVLFIVDPQGKVENPIVHSSTDPALEKAALSAVKQWRFEPGRRSGKAVRFRMRVPITFKKGS